VTARTREILSSSADWAETYERCLEAEREHARTAPGTYAGEYTEAERVWFRSPLRGDSTRT
jgi:hypothetical protein